MAKNTEKAIAALINNSTVRDASIECGLSEETLYRYLRNEDFKSEYKAAQLAIVDNAVSALQQAANEAVETLRRNLNCNNPQAEIRAAQLILDNVFGNSDNGKTANREVVISFNFNNQVRLTNDKN
jgi:hypothetical protein